MVSCRPIQFGSGCLRRKHMKVFHWQDTPAACALIMTFLKLLFLWSCSVAVRMQEIAPSPEGKNVAMGAFVRDVFLEQVAPVLLILLCALLCIPSVRMLGSAVTACGNGTDWWAVLRGREVFVGVCVLTVPMYHLLHGMSTSSSLNRSGPAFLSRMLRRRRTPPRWQPSSWPRSHIPDPLSIHFPCCG